MKIISVQTSIDNKIPLGENFDILHDAIVEVEGKTYSVSIKAKDTIDAAEKILNMKKELLNDFLHQKFKEY